MVSRFPWLVALALDPLAVGLARTTKISSRAELRYRSKESSRPGSCHGSRREHCRDAFWRLRFVAARCCHRTSDFFLVSKFQRVESVILVVLRFLTGFLDLWPVWHHRIARFADRFDPIIAPSDLSSLPSTAPQAPGRTARDDELGEDHRIVVPPIGNQAIRCRSIASLASPDRLTSR